MDADGDVPFRPRTGKAAATPLLPEVEAYLQLLLLVHLTNNKRYTEVSISTYISTYLQLLLLVYLANNKRYKELASVPTYSCWSTRGMRRTGIHPAAKAGPSIIPSWKSRTGLNSGLSFWRQSVRLFFTPLPPRAPSGSEGVG